MVEKFWQDNLRTLYQGDCRSMEELADESIQCVVTSPPYWGLRKYAGLSDLIWGGFPNCQHEWIIQSRDTRHDHTWATSSPIENRPETQYIEVVKGQYCQLCGAWRGQLGLEPLPDCGRPFVKLRDDLTEKEFEYVAGELKRCGLL